MASANAFRGQDSMGQVAVVVLKASKKGKDFILLVYCLISALGAQPTHHWSQ
jgi:hypothetical protein